MGSSNGVTRGQLRPYFSGRTPPFILVGTFIVLVIFGFSYWSLNSQYGDLQVEVHEFQEELRSTAQKRLELEKQSHSLRDQLLSAQESYAKCQDSVQKKEDELADLSEQVRDASKLQNQIVLTKNDLDKCVEEKSRNDGECSNIKDVNKQLDTENGELKKSKDEMQQKITSLENEQRNLQAQIEQLKQEKQAVTQAPVNKVPDEPLKQKKNEKLDDQLSHNDVNDVNGNKISQQEELPPHENADKKVLEDPQGDADPNIGLPPLGDRSNNAITSSTVTDVKPEDTEATTRAVQNSVDKNLNEGKVQEAAADRQAM